MYRFCALLLVCVILGGLALKAKEEKVTLVSAGQIARITGGIEFLPDSGHKLSVDRLLHSGLFTSLGPGTPNFGNTKAMVWLRFRVRNETGATRLVLKIANPGLDSIRLFCPGSVDSAIFIAGLAVAASKTESHIPNFEFAIHVPDHGEQNIYLGISSTGPIIVPMEIGSEAAIAAEGKNQDFFWGMYIGLMLAMVVYNFFVMLTTRDRSYLYYIFYVLAVLLVQTTESGYVQALLRAVSVHLARWNEFLAPSMSGITAIVFVRSFIRTRAFVPLMDRIFWIFMAAYMVAVGLCLGGVYGAGFTLMDVAASLLSLYFIVVASVIARKGYRPAQFFLAAWVVFLVGIFVFVFKNFNLLPYNNVTVYMMPVGSAMEAMLLAFALADRINTLKKEKVISQQRAVDALKENQRIIKHQNSILEQKVAERTNELEVANGHLVKAFNDLKGAQMQLVQSEKMASLGQLTAGVAHEINNPVNFISANVKPLNRDVSVLLHALAEAEKLAYADTQVLERRQMFHKFKEGVEFDMLKDEIDLLLKGIADGAHRTAEIVRGLRIFSRHDEDVLKLTDLNEGLEATLVIANNMIGSKIELQKKLGNIPLVECYPGKMNQVFLNIISNAVFAIKERFGDMYGGALRISTTPGIERVIIKIGDNGTGMTDETRKRLFEPFFTTKGVGVGTGLGLSISYSIVQGLQGEITMESELGVGTEFEISLPVLQGTQAYFQ